MEKEYHLAYLLVCLRSRLQLLQKYQSSAMCLVFHLAFVNNYIMKLLLVEDDKALGRLLKKGLEEEGFFVDWVSNGLTAQQYLEENSYEVIILDLMLPKQDGLSLLESLRKQGINTPVLILTAKGSVEDKVKGLNAGADDYLAKPSAFEELVARIKALLRRQHGIAQGIISFGDVSVDIVRQRVEFKGQELELTGMELKLLMLLALNSNEDVNFWH